MSPRYVEIVVKGALGDQLQTEFDNVTVSGDAARVRLMTRDASELYAALDRLEALGFELLAVHRLDDPPPERRKAT